MVDGSENCTVILASGSPRRVELMKWFNLDYSISTPEIDESILDGEDVAAYGDRVAREKWATVAALKRSVRPCVIVAADTIVIRNQVRYGKPRDREDAVRILRELRGRYHLVHSALVVGKLTSEGVVRYESASDTRVRLSDFSDEELSAYVDSGDPFGKAGGYAIQNDAFHPVAEYEGCYAGVVGLPLCHLDKLLRKVGVVPSAPVSESCRFRRQGLCEMNCAEVQSAMSIRKAIFPLKTAGAPTREMIFDNLSH